MSISLLFVLLPTPSCFGDQLLQFLHLSGGDILRPQHAQNELVERAVRWVERHPRTVVTGALVVTALGVLLAQSLPNPLKSETPSDETEAPLFI